MYKILYHGITRERLALYIYHGELGPIRCPQSNPYPSICDASKPTELACIPAHGNNHKQAIQEALMWALVGAIASTEDPDASSVYVLHLGVPDNIVKELPDATTIIDLSRSLPLSTICGVYTFPVTTRERMIAACFSKLQSTSPSFDISVDWEEFCMSYLPISVQESICAEMQYTEIPPMECGEGFLNRISAGLRLGRSFPQPIKTK